ncbi:hypothetical protein SHIRM173S_04482 [Streptomyces hirsutus]
MEPRFSASGFWPTVKRLGDRHRSGRRGFCSTRLARIKRPRYVLLTQDMPLTPTGKVAKHLLRADATLRDRAREVDVSVDQQPARPEPR